MAEKHNMDDSFDDLHYFKPMQVNTAAEFLWRNKKFPDKQSAYKYIFDMIRKVIKLPVGRGLRKDDVFVIMEAETARVYIDPTPNEKSVAEVEVDLVRSIERD